MHKFVIAQISCACLLLGGCSTIRDWMPEMGNKASSETAAVEEDASMVDVEEDMSMVSDQGDMSVTADGPDTTMAEGDTHVVVEPDPGTHLVEPGNSFVTIDPPEGSGAHKYCRRGDNGNTLRVTLTNSGNIASSTGGTIDVTYRTNGGDVTNSAPYAALGIGEITTTSVPIAPGCFNADCIFNIQWTDTRSVAGICIG